MKLLVDANRYIEYVYTIADDYLIDFDINLVRMEKLIPSGKLYEFAMANENATN